MRVVVESVRRSAVVVALGAAGVAACYPLIGPPPAREMVQPPEYDTLTSIVCDPLDPGAAGNDTVMVSRVVGPEQEGDVVIDLPESGPPAARLKIPEDAVPEGRTVTVTMRAPAASEFAYVEVSAAFDAEGVTFEEDLLVSLLVTHRNCTNLKPAADTLGTYIYNIEDLVPSRIMRLDPPQIAVIRRGGMVGEPIIGSTIQARGLTRDFSGFILAQGRR